MADHRLRLRKQTSEQPTVPEIIDEDDIGQYNKEFESFRALKEGRSLARLIRTKADLEAAIVTVSDLCRSLSELLKTGAGDFMLLRTNQNERDSCRQKLVLIQKQIDAHGEKSPDTEREFNEILNLPQIIDVRAESPDLVVFTIIATTVVDGTTYHLGNWDVYFGNVDLDLAPRKGASDGNYFRTRRSFETRIGPSKTEIPYFNRSDGSFCFGNNADAIDKHVLNRNYLHALQMMATYMSHVPEGKKVNVPKYFAELEREEPR